VGCNKERLCTHNTHLVQDDPKLLDDSGNVPKPNEVAGSSTPGSEIVSLLHGETS
jgi:hypothetical protein